ncbi:MAG: hypothetical protein A2Y41_06175 [Spirochaetes bacterium GWB1_36_13]|nr:MAG: hypothetical protein A2Y41_06175 [Spirochaetes bacterium GWB1_36_13]
MREKNLLTVGEISCICNLSSRVLRHYDKINLFKPVFSDPNTGYRYYKTEQVFIISMIQDLKSIGFSLEEIKKILERESVLSIQNLCKKKKSEISKEIERLKKMEEDLEHRIELFSQISFLEKNIQDFSDFYVELKAQPERKILSIKEKKSFHFNSVAIQVREIQKLAESNSIHIQGPYLIIFHENFENPDNTLWEMGCLLSQKEEKYFQNIQIISSGLFVSTLYWGNHQASLTAYRQMKEWIKKNHYEEIGAPIKLYIKSLAFTHSDKNLLVEIQIPVKKI